MAFIPKAHEIYRHFKGNLYQIIAVAEHSETGEQLVIYQAMYGEFQIYARPLDMFTGRVDRAKYPEAAQEFRFELQGPEADRQKRESEQEEPLHPGANGQTVLPANRQAPGGIEKPKQPEPEEPGEPQLDPMVLEFLDADTYEARLNILAGLHHRITDDMITTMSIACDIEVDQGDVEERYEQLKNCLLTKERFEVKRLTSYELSAY